ARRVLHPLIREPDVAVVAARDRCDLLVGPQNVVIETQRVICGIVQTEVDRADRALLIAGPLEVDEVPRRVADALAVLILIAVLVAVARIQKDAETPGAADVPRIAERELRADIGVERAANRIHARVEAVEQVLMD